MDFETIYRANVRFCLYFYCSFFSFDSNFSSLSSYAAVGLLISYFFYA